MQHYILNKGKIRWNICNQTDSWQHENKKLRQTSGFRKRCSFCFPGDEGTMRETSSSSSDSWSRIMIMISRSQALAKVPPGVGDRGGVKAGEVWTANACATLWPEKEIFSGLLAISASSHYFGDKHFVTHLNESPLLITFFPLVQKFLNLKQNDDSCQRSFLLPNIFLLSKIFCCQRFVVVPKHFLLFPKIILVPKDNFGFQR